MAIKVKAKETLIKVGPYQNTYHFVLGKQKEKLPSRTTEELFLSRIKSDD